MSYGAGSAFDSSSLVLSDYQVVPEPGTLLLLGIGLGGFAVLGRRRPPG